MRCRSDHCQADTRFPRKMELTPVRGTYSADVVKGVQQYTDVHEGLLSGFFNAPIIIRETPPDRSSATGGMYTLPDVGGSPN